jgi:hypothetical protein
MVLSNKVPVAGILSNRPRGVWNGPERTGGYFLKTLLKPLTRSLG